MSSSHLTTQDLAFQYGYQPISIIREQTFSFYVFRVELSSGPYTLRFIKRQELEKFMMEFTKSLLTISKTPNLTGESIDTLFSDLERDDLESYFENHEPEKKEIGMSAYDRLFPKKQKTY